MKKILLALGLILAPVTAQAVSIGQEMQIDRRCQPDNLLTKENATKYKLNKFTEFTDPAQIAIIVDVITSVKFDQVQGQIYPNVTVEKVGVFEVGTEVLVIVFADKDNCVWSFYNFTEEDRAIFFNEVAKRGA